MRKLLKPNSLIVVFLGLSKFRFYRKWWGGHWELWWVDFPVCSEVWHDLNQCSLEAKKRPYGLLRGTPVCEDYTFDRLKLSSECLEFNCQDCLCRAVNGKSCECDCHKKQPLESSRADVHFSSASSKEAVSK